MFTSQDIAGTGGDSYQPQCFSCRYLHGEEDLMVRHVQNDLILRDQNVTAAVRVRTEGGVGVSWCGTKEKQDTPVEFILIHK